MSWTLQKRVWQASSHRGSALLVLLAIADFAREEEGGECYASVETIAKKARLSPREARRIINERLKPSGELDIRERRGKTSFMSVRLPEAGTPATGDTPVMGDRPPRSSGVGTPVARDRPPRSPATPKPLPNPNEPTSNQKGAAAPFVTEDEYVRAVVAAWREARERHGIPKYIDDAAIKNLKDAARRLYGEGLTVDEVAKGIVQHADDPDANPWRGVGEWAREARAEREEREARDGASRAAMERRRVDDQRVEDEWQALERESGLTRREILRRRNAGA